MLYAVACTTQIWEALEPEAWLTAMGMLAIEHRSSTKAPLTRSINLQKLQNICLFAESSGHGALEG